MINRVQLKEHAKKTFKANYWKCVLVSLIMGLISGYGSEGIGTNVGSDVAGPQFSDMGWTGEEFYVGLYYLERYLVPVLMVSLVVIAIAVAVNVFAFNPLRVGADRFHVVNAYEPAGVEELGKAFTTGYKNVVKAMFLTDLYIFLWSLLLVVPGIIASYRYRLVPYLLAEHPELSPKEVQQLSDQMMMGKKGEAFVLDLSFLGWNILSGITFGVVGLFYAAPYQRQTNANFYIALSRNQ